MHAEAPGQATPISRPPWPPGTFDVAWRVHLLPSHRSATVEAAPELSKEAPTAVQADEDVHETLFRKANWDPDGFGVDFTVHFVPFHRSASVPRLEAPTAVHTVEDVHDTPEKPPNCAPAGIGVGWIVQAVPFQRSASVMPAPELSRKVPTAVQAEADEQDTAFKNGPCAPGGSGIDWRLHVVPSHRSASAWSAPELSR